MNNYNLFKKEKKTSQTVVNQQNHLKLSKEKNNINKLMHKQYCHVHYITGAPPHKFARKTFMSIKTCHETAIHDKSFEREKKTASPITLGDIPRRSIFFFSKWFNNLGNWNWSSSTVDLNLRVGTFQQAWSRVSYFAIGLAKLNRLLSVLKLLNPITVMALEVSRQFACVRACVCAYVGGRVSERIRAT